MTFTFHPMTDEEIAQSRLLIPGEYIFMTMEAWEKVSKSGNPMIELVIKIFRGDGSSYTMKDWLPSNKGMSWKIKHYLQTIEKEDLYAAGNFSSVLLPGSIGVVKIKHNDKNMPTVEDYLKHIGELILPNQLIELSHEFENREHEEVVEYTGVPF